MPGWNGLPSRSCQVSGALYRLAPNTASLLQFCCSRGRKPPRSRIRMRLPDGARRWASVPPPAPLPMMMTSYWSCDMVGLPVCGRALAIKNAVSVTVVMQLGAGGAMSAPDMKFGGEQHAERRRGQINPDAVPDAARQRRGDA